MRHPPVTRPRRALRVRAGFSLIELMIVLVLASVVMAMAVPRIDYTRGKADAAAQALRTELQKAQRNALIRQHDIWVTFDTATGVIRLAENRNNNATIEADERISRTRLQEDAFLHVPAKRVDGATGAASLVGTMSKVDNMPTIIMRRDGSASTDFEVYFRVIKGKREHWRAVTVARATGRTEWYRGSPAGTVWKRGGM